LKQGAGVWLCGVNGSGKSAVMDLMQKIIGTTHFIHLQNMNDLVGEFNAALTNKIGAFIDEASMNDPKAYATLKNLMTGSTQRKRLMHSDPDYVESFLNCFFACNEKEKAIPVDKNSRRFSVLFSENKPLLCTPHVQGMYRVANCLDTDHKIDVDAQSKWYFDMLYTSLYANENHGLKVFANFLYNVPVDQFEHRKISVTKLLMQNKEQNMTPIAKWWMKILKAKNNDSSKDDPKWHVNEKVENLLAIWQSTEAFKDLKASRKKSFHDEEEFLPALQEVLPCTVWIDKSYQQIGRGNPKVTRSLMGMDYDSCIDALNVHYPGAFHLVDENSEETLLQIRTERCKGVNYKSWHEGYIPNPFNKKKLPIHPIHKVPNITCKTEEEWLEGLEDDDKRGFKVNSQHDYTTLWQMYEKSENYNPPAVQDTSKKPKNSVPTQQDSTISFDHYDDF
jgi:hypothetical protein